MGRFDNDGRKVGLNGSADGYLSNVHQLEKGKYPITSDAEKGYGFSFQGSKPMALPGPGQLVIPPSTDYTLMQAIENCVDRCLEAVEIAIGLHSDNTIAVRTTVSSKPYPKSKSIEVGEYETMSPDPS